MKTFTKILALILIACIVLALMLSCNKEKKYSDLALQHLKSRYAENTFTVNNVVREGDTSGRYVVDANCNEDKIDFKVFVYSSLLISDGYSVTKANSIVDSELDSLLTENHYDEYVSDIQWLRIYNESGTDYSFVEVNDPEKVTLEDVKDISKIVFRKDISLEDISELIISLSELLEETCINLETISFEFVINGKTYVATLPVSYIDSALSEEVLEFLEEKIQESNKDETISHFYWKETEAIVITVSEETETLESTQVEEPNNK